MPGGTDLVMWCPASARTPHTSASRVRSVPASATSAPHPNAPSLPAGFAYRPIDLQAHILARACRGGYKTTRTLRCVCRRWNAPVCLHRASTRIFDPSNIRRFSRAPTLSALPYALSLETIRCERFGRSAEVESRFLGMALAALIPLSPTLTSLQLHRVGLHDSRVLTAALSHAPQLTSLDLCVPMPDWAPFWTDNPVIHHRS